MNSLFVQRVDLNKLLASPAALLTDFEVRVEF